LCKIIQTLNGPKPDPLRLKGGGLQRSLGKLFILTTRPVRLGHSTRYDLRLCEILKSAGQVL
jgi:hypothetical protein